MPTKICVAIVDNRSHGQVQLQSATRSWSDKPTAGTFPRSGALAVLVGASTLRVAGYDRLAVS